MTSSDTYFASEASNNEDAEIRAMRQTPPDRIYAAAARLEDFGSDILDTDIVDDETARLLFDTDSDENGDDAEQLDDADPDPEDAASAPANAVDGDAATVGEEQQVAPTDGDPEPPPADLAGLSPTVADTDQAVQDAERAGEAEPGDETEADPAQQASGESRPEPGSPPAGEDGPIRQTFIDDPAAPDRGVFLDDVSEAMAKEAWETDTGNDDEATAEPFSVPDLAAIDRDSDEDDLSYSRDNDTVEEPDDPVIAAFGAQDGLRKDDSSTTDDDGLREEFRPDDPARDELDPAAIALGDAARGDGGSLAHPPYDLTDTLGDIEHKETQDDEFDNLLAGADFSQREPQPDADRTGETDPDSDIEALLHDAPPAGGVPPPSAPEAGTGTAGLDDLLAEVEPEAGAQPPAEPSLPGEEEEEALDDELLTLARQYDPGRVPEADAGGPVQPLAGGSPFEPRYPREAADTGEPATAAPIDEDDGLNALDDILLATAPPPPGHRSQASSETARSAPAEDDDDETGPPVPSSPETDPDRDVSVAAPEIQASRPPQAAPAAGAQPPRQEKSRMKFSVPWRRRAVSSDESAADAAQQQADFQEPPPPDMTAESRRRRPGRGLFLVALFILPPSLLVIWMFMEDPRQNSVLRAYIPPPLLETVAVSLGHNARPVEISGAGATTPAAIIDTSDPAVEPQPELAETSPADSLLSAPPGGIAPVGQQLDTATPPQEAPQTQQTLPPVDHIPFDRRANAPDGTAAALPAIGQQQATLPPAASPAASPAIAQAGPLASPMADKPREPAPAAAPSAPDFPSTGPAVRTVSNAEVEKFNTTVARLAEAVADLSDDMRVVLESLPPPQTVAAAQLEDVDTRLTLLQDGMDQLVARIDDPEPDPGQAPSTTETASLSATPPPKPSGLTALPGRDRITLTWETPPGPVTLWLYSTRADGPWSDWMAVPGSSGLTNSHTFTDLLPGRQYAFRIKAANGGAEGDESDIVSAITGTTMASTAFQPRPATEMHAVVVRPFAVGPPIDSYPGRVYRAPRARFSITNRTPPDLGNVNKNDWLPGYGRVLHVISNEHGRTVVTENGNLFDSEPIVPPAGMPETMAPDAIITSPASPPPPARQ